MADRAATEPIPVPWANRVRHWFTQRLQAVLFLLSVIAVCVLWYNQSPTVLIKGQVEAARSARPGSRPHPARG